METLGTAHRHRKIHVRVFSFDVGLGSPSHLSLGKGLSASVPGITYLWLVGNEGMGYNYNYYYYHSSIPYQPKVGLMLLGRVPSRVL